MTAPRIAVVHICVTPKTYLSPPGVDKIILFLWRTACHCATRTQKGMWPVSCHRLGNPIKHTRSRHPSMSSAALHPALVSNCDYPRGPSMTFKQSQRRNSALGLT